MMAMVEAASRIINPELRADYQHKAGVAVEKITRAQVPAGLKVDALADVSRLAAEKGQNEVAVEALHGLDTAVTGSPDPRVFERRPVTRPPD